MPLATGSATAARVGRNLALFDFDGTITERDTFLPFIEFSISCPRMLAGKVLLSPLVAAYRLSLISPRSIREAIARFAFAGANACAVKALGEQFARDQLPSLVRSRAEERLQWHVARGDRVVVVSASLDAYLAPWCKTRGFDLICTRLEARNDRLTGRFEFGDCSAERKRACVLAKYDISDFDAVYAYGDTAEDEDMLGLADHQYFRWRERLR